MAKVSINYGRLEDAAEAAGKAADRLSEYGSAVTTHVTRRLDSYTGSITGNISNARSQAQSKIDTLATQREAPMRAFQTDVTNFRAYAEQIDRDVETEITGIFNDFRTSYNLGTSNPNFIWDALSSILPDTWVNALRNFGDFLATIGQGFYSLGHWIGESVKDWYRYQGGKEAIETALAVVEVVIAAIALVVAIISGAGLLAIITGVIASAIALADSGTKLFNRAESYNMMASGDPVWSDRYSDRADAGEGLTDTMRRYSDSQMIHNVATGIDAVDFACSTISFMTSMHDISKMVKQNGGIKTMATKKWADVKGFFSGNVFENVKSTFSLSKLKAFGATYFTATDGSKRSASAGYSVLAENIGIGDMMFGGKKYNAFGRLLNVGDGALSSTGLRGLLNGDRSLGNVLVTLSKVNSVFKAVNPVKFSNLDDVKIDISGYKKYLGGFTSTNPETGKVSTASVGDYVKKTTSLYKDMKDLAKK